MRSEFENSIGHTEGFHDGYVKWNELSKQYESSDEDYLDVAEWMNGALAIYEKRQIEIDELKLQVAEMKSRLNDAYTDGQSAMYTARQSKVDELQKRVDAVKGLAQTLWEKSEEKHQQGKVWESKTLGECADEILDVLEQALKGGSDANQ